MIISTYFVKVYICFGSTLSRRNVFVVLYLSKERQKVMCFFAPLRHKKRCGSPEDRCSVWFRVFFLDFALFCPKMCRKYEKNELLSGRQKFVLLWRRRRDCLGTLARSVVPLSPTVHAALTRRSVALTGRLPLEKSPFIRHRRRSIFLPLAPPSLAFKSHPPTKHRVCGASLANNYIFDTNLVNHT